MRIFSWGIIVMLAAAPALAQSPGDPDAEGCKDSTLLTRMPGCTIVECSAREFDAVTLQVRPVTDDPGTQELEGAIEFVQYVCPARLSFIQLQRNALNAFKAAGYTIVLNGRDGNDNPIVTARKGPQWVQVETTGWNDDTSYKLTAVKVEEMKQEIAADASAMAEAINRSGAVAVYGITFDTGKAALQAGSEQVLGEIVKLLQAHADWQFEVQGHTDNVGRAAANLALSEQRAKAVVAWLTGRGIDAGRLVAKGYGDSRPVGDNASEDGRAKNRRVELKKLNEE